ncbi:MAG: DUF308 domain-containing protein [Candidatus Peribacteria bacterium]|nr:MAG: DUF308 domain-containing protein [Candidatus Peribacteria bacterium]
MKAPLLVSGLFTLVLGVVFLTRPAISVELLAIFLGMWGVIAGIGTLVFSFDVAKKVFTHRW